MFKIIPQANGRVMVRDGDHGHGIITDPSRVEQAKVELAKILADYQLRHPPVVDTWQAGVYSPAQPQLPLPKPQRYM